MSCSIKRIPFFFYLLLLHQLSYSQSYTSYFTGDAADVSTITQPVTVLMGGATENDNAMRWFLQHSGGGDIIVLRTSGSDGYNDYLYSGLGVAVNSVETILCNSAAASYDPYVLQQVKNAEAIWFAGGDQWKYVSYWNNTPLDTLINYLINVKHVPVGGTSAGMAIQGNIVFTAQNGSVTSSAALSNPYNSSVTLLKDDFIFNRWLNNVVTDTHFDNPDRRGRLAAFCARVYKDYHVPAYAIACEEYTAVCIDTNGTATIYGNYPGRDDYAYFVQTNCALPAVPETCVPGQPLTWLRNNQALKVYKVAGTQTGINSFQLTNWKTGTGGSWQDWYVNGAVFNVNINATAPACTVVPLNDGAVNICPPASQGIVITTGIAGTNFQWQLNDSSGFININDNGNYTGTGTNTLQLNDIPSDWYGYQYRCVVDGNNSNIASIKFTSNWKGLEGTAWENPANWECGALPDINTDVILNNGNTVEINTEGQCRTLWVKPGANFTVKTGGHLQEAH